MEAAYRSQPETIRLLIEAGANPQQEAKYRDTALHGFALSTSGEDDVDNTVGHLLVTAGGQLEARDNDGDTPLLYAVINNQAQCFRALCRLGARLDVLNKDGCTVLHLAVCFGTWELFTALREAVQDLCVDPDIEDKWGETAMEEFEWRIRFGSLSEQERALDMMIWSDMPPPSDDEIDCFRELIREIREVHNFPEGRSSHQQTSDKVPMPGGWLSDAEETDEESEREDGASSGTSDGRSDEDET